MVVRGDGGDLDAGAVEGSEVPLGSILGPLDLVAEVLVVVGDGEAWVVTLQLRTDGLLGGGGGGGGRRPHMEIWTCRFEPQMNRYVNHALRSFELQSRLLLQRGSAQRPAELKSNSQHEA